MPWFVASSGLTVAVSLYVSPSVRARVVLSNVTEDTGTVTVMTQVAVIFPALAVMVAVPALIAVMMPFPSTVATSGLSLVQSTLFRYASSGCNVTKSSSVSPLTIAADVLSRVKPVTAGAST